MKSKRTSKLGDGRTSKDIVKCWQDLLGPELVEVLINEAHDFCMNGNREYWMDIERIKRKFVIVDPSTGCWNWTGFKNNKGYGIITRNNRQLKAHRVMYHLKTGFALASSALILHICNNKKCVNPDHLKEGTESENRQEYWNQKKGIT